MNVFLICLMAFALSSAIEMSDFSNVKLLSNPIKTKRFGGNLTDRDCDFECPLLYQHMDITQGVWQIKVDSVLFVNHEQLEFETVFDIKTDLLTTYESLANVMVDPVHDGRFVQGCRVANSVVCPNLQIYESYPSMTSTQQTIWSKDVALTRQQKFVFITSAQSGSEWYTIDVPKLNGFRVFLEMRPSVRALISRSLKFEINFLFRRMK